MTFTFTCITEIRGNVHLTQHQSQSPNDALREHISALPCDDGTGPFDEELEWFQDVAGGQSDVTLIPVGHCKNTWLWLDGARYEPQCLTYLVQTDTGDAALAPNAD